MQKTNQIQKPHSIEAEEALLGSLLIEPDQRERVVFLSRDDFFLVKNQWIWDAIAALSGRRAPVDFVTVCEELERRGQLAEIGGAGYVSHLINVVPTAIHAEGYGRIVQQTSLRRKMLNVASTIAQWAYEEDGDVAEQLDKAQQLIIDITPQREGNIPEPLPALLADYYRQIEWRYEHRDALLGVPTGLADLDRLLGGLQKSDLAIVAARPGMGKTSLLLNIALNASRTFGQRVAFFSLEMSKEQVVERLTAQQGGIDSHKLRTGRLDDADWPRFVEVTSHLAANDRLWIDDTSALSPMQLRSKVRRLHHQHGLDLIVVDYLQRMATDGRRENRTQEVSYLARALKTLAGELHLPVLTAAQLSRAVEQRPDKRPQLSDLRESGDIENEADVVAFLSLDSDALPAAGAQAVPYELVIAKHRKGPTGAIPLIFRKHLTQFVSAATHEVVL